VLRSELGACYAGPGRQRWGWASSNQAGWIEFRPGGVLWTKDEGVGAWQAWGEESRARLSIHLCRGDHNEVRHVMQLRRGGDQMELEELYREVVRPLGFSRSSMERKVRCWLLGPPRQSGAPAAVTATPSKEEEDQVAGSPAASPQHAAQLQQPVGQLVESPATDEKPSFDGALSAAPQNIDATNVTNDAPATASCSGQPIVQPSDPAQQVAGASEAAPPVGQVESTMPAGSESVTPGALGTPPVEDSGGDVVVPPKAPARSKLAYLL